MNMFKKTRQVAFVSYALAFCYVQDSLNSIPKSVAIKGDYGWQIWI